MKGVIHSHYQCPYASGIKWKISEKYSYTSQFLGHIHLWELLFFHDVIWRKHLKENVPMCHRLNIICIAKISIYCNLDSTVILSQKSRLNHLIKSIFVQSPICFVCLHIVLCKDNWYNCNLTNKHFPLNSMAITFSVLFLCQCVQYVMCDLCKLFNSCNNDMPKWDLKWHSCIEVTVDWRL